MESSLIFNFLWLVPITAWIASRNISPLWRSTIRGFSFGAVVSPAALGLYGLYFLGPFAAIFGILGLALTLVHGAIGYNLAIAFGIVPSNTVVGAAGRLPVEIINGVFWSVVYGGLCYAWRYFRNYRATKP